MDNKRIIGQRLRALRINQDISQETMAFHLGISQSAYSRMETGKIWVNMDVLEKAAQLFGLNFDRLVMFCYGNAPLHELLRELDEKKPQPQTTQKLTDINATSGNRIIPIQAAMVS